MNSRFDAEMVVRAAMLTEHGRFEIELRDSLGRLHIVSLPATSAVELGCLISDVSQAAPYMLGGAGGTGSRKK